MLKRRVKAVLSRTWWAYDGAALIDALRTMGVAAADTVMVHSSWREHNGFSGKPADVAGALRQLVGEDGLLVMPSMPYHNMSTAQFLARGKPLDVRRTPSMMGMVSESFRRSDGVVRSLSPTHPLVAWGRDSHAFVAGHELTDEPFGRESPFARLLQRDAWLLGLDAPFASFTFTHHVEVLTSQALLFPLYEPEALPATVIDPTGRRIECRVRVISEHAHRARREERLVAELHRRGSWRQRRVGNTDLLLIRAQDVLQAASGLVVSGQHFFEIGPLPGRD